MTILLVGVCVGGKVVRNGSWTDDSGKRHWGITGPTPCEKCGGKGCRAQDEKPAITAE